MLLIQRPDRCAQATMLYPRAPHLRPGWGHQSYPRRHALVHRGQWAGRVAGEVPPSILVRARRLRIVRERFDRYRLNQSRHSNGLVTQLRSCAGLREAFWRRPGAVDRVTHVYADGVGVGLCVLYMCWVLWPWGWASVRPLFWRR
jgi:hypothetical protein